VGVGSKPGIQRLEACRSTAQELGRFHPEPVFEGDFSAQSLDQRLAQLRRRVGLDIGQQVEG
jgi:hypothetical protein